MRIVFLTHNYPRWPGDVAGAFLATLARALVQRGLDVRVVAPSHEGNGGEETGRDGVYVRRVRYASARAERFAYGGMRAAISSPAGLVALARMCRALRRGAREELQRGTVIHAHWWIPAGLSAPGGAPLVLTSHGSDAALLGASRVARSLARPVYRRADVVTAVSGELATWIHAAAGRRVEPPYVRPMPVDTDHFVPSRGGGGAVVIARLVRQKRVHLAIEAVADLAARGQPLPLTIVGDGPERERLERLACQRNATTLVRFAGAVRPDEVPSYLATADVMLFPAHREGFGLVAAEAFLAQVPVVVCRDGGGVLDIVPEQGGGRQVAPTPTAIADAALELLQSPATPAALRALRDRWRERLSADSIAEACEGWYHEALTRRRPG